MNRTTLFGFIAVAAVTAILVRLFPHPANFTSVGALALFTGVYGAKYSKWVLGLPLLVMFLSDLVVGFYTPFVMAAVYFGILLYGIIGMAVSRNASLSSVVGGSLTGSILFFLITNAAVWAFSGMYPETLVGLGSSYIAGLPFLRFTVAGDLVFTGVFFGAFSVLRYALKSGEKQVERVIQSS